MANFILYEKIICDDKDSLWIKNRTKKLICERNFLYKDYGKNNDLSKFLKNNVFAEEVASGRLWRN